jgi:hypothetical protein
MPPEKAISTSVAPFVFQPEIGRVGAHPAERDRAGIEHAIELAGEDRHLAPVRIGARRARRRVGIGDVFRNHAHAAGLRAQAGRGDRHGFEKIHLCPPSRVSREPKN